MTKRVYGRAIDMAVRFSTWDDAVPHADAAPGNRGDTESGQSSRRFTENEMTKQSVDHVERAKAAWPILVRRARSGAGPISYGELCHEIGVHYRASAYLLGVIQRYCADNDHPKLQALVVNKKTGVLGGGYVGARGRKDHLREVTKVNEYNWSARAPRF